MSIACLLLCQQGPEARLGSILGSAMPGTDLSHTSLHSSHRLGPMGMRISPRAATLTRRFGCSRRHDWSHQRDGIQCRDERRIEHSVHSTRDHRKCCFAEISPVGKGRSRTVVSSFPTEIEGSPSSTRNPLQWLGFGNWRRESSVSARTLLCPLSRGKTTTRPLQNFCALNSCRHCTEQEMEPLDDGRSSSYPRVGYRHSGVRLGLSLSSCGRWAEPSHVVFYGSSPPWLHPQFCAVALS